MLGNIFVKSVLQAVFGNFWIFNNWYMTVPVTDTVNFLVLILESCLFTIFHDRSVSPTFHSWQLRKITGLTFADDLLLVGKVDNIEYENIKNLTLNKWLKSGELKTNPNLVPHV